MPPTTRKAPQDRLAKKPSGFTFDHEGTTYTLAPPSDGLAQLSGRDFRDALLDGEEGQMRMAFRCLELVEDIDGPALAALYAKPTPEMLPIVNKWFESARENEATGPQS
jgi:hypothetical protein